MLWLKQRIIQWVLILIPIGILTITIYFGDVNQLSFITPQRVMGIIYYRFDIKSYLLNLQTTIQDIPLIKFITPPIYEINGIEDIVKNIFNVIVSGVNVLMYPIQIGSHLIRVVGALLGIDFSPDIEHNLTWLINFVNYFVKGQIIPYL